MITNQEAHAKGTIAVPAAVNGALFPTSLEPEFASVQQRTTANGATKPEQIVLKALRLSARFLRSAQQKRLKSFPLKNHNAISGMEAQKAAKISHAWIIKHRNAAIQSPMTSSTG